MSGPTIVTKGPDSEAMAMKLKEAMDGFGTNESDIIDCLTSISCEDRCDVAVTYKTAYGQDLIEDLKSEIGGNFEDVIVAMMTPRLLFEARELNKAVHGLGTDESTLVQILCTKSNEEIDLLKDAYQSEFESNLEDALVGDAGGNFRNLLVSLVQGQREEYSMSCSPEEDAQEIFQAGEGQCGTEESAINKILCLRSTYHLRQVFAEYEKLSGGTTLVDAIKSETSGTLKEGFLSLILFTQNPLVYYAKLLKDAMEGFGTEEATLIRVIVTRSEIDLEDIKTEFCAQYEQSLYEAVDADCGGDFKKVLLGLIQGNKC